MTPTDKEKYSEIKANLDDLHYRMECGVAIVGAIHTALTEGETTGEEWHDALFGAYSLLRQMNSELRSEVDALYKLS